MGNVFGSVPDLSCPMWHRYCCRMRCPCFSRSIKLWIILKVFQKDTRLVVIRFELASIITTAECFWLSRLKLKEMEKNWNFFCNSICTQQHTTEYSDLKHYWLGMERLRDAWMFFCFSSRDSKWIILYLEARLFFNSVWKSSFVHKTLYA